MTCSVEAVHVLTQHLLGLTRHRNLQPTQVALHVVGVASQFDTYLMHICLVGIYAWWPCVSGILSSATC